MHQGTDLIGVALNLFDVRDALVRFKLFSFENGMFGLFIEGNHLTRFDNLSFICEQVIQFLSPVVSRFWDLTIILIS